MRRESVSKREEAITAISRAILGRTATVAAPAAFDAVMAVLMEPDQPMLMAGRKQTFADMTGEHLGPNAERTFQAILRAAAK